MGQSKWAWGCALLVALTIAHYVVAQEPQDPFAASSEPGRPGPGAPDTDTPGDAERRIESVLNQRLKEPLDFIEQPLRDIVTILSETYDIPIQFDNAALDAVAASPDVEVNIQINRVTLRSALDLMLRNAGAEELTYIVDNEVLLITTQEEAEQRLKIKVYRVDDLIADSTPAGMWYLVADFDTLIDIIVSNVEQESWAENGTGEGEVHAFPPGMIVITTTARIHEQIENFLANLRRIKAAIDVDSAEKRAAAARRPVLHSIAFGDPALTSTKEAQDVIRDALQRSVDWEVDGEEVSEDDVFLHVLPQRIVVRHLPSVVLQVEDAARALLPGFNNVGGDPGSGGFLCGGGDPAKPDRAKPATPSGSGEGGGFGGKGGGGF